MSRHFLIGRFRSYFLSLLSSVRLMFCDLPAACRRHRGRADSKSSLDIGVVHMNGLERRMGGGGGGNSGGGGGGGRRAPAALDLAHFSGAGAGAAAAASSGSSLAAAAANRKRGKRKVKKGSRKSIWSYAGLEIVHRSVTNVYGVTVR